MKVLLFTHVSDIDGLGNVVLAKLAFDDVLYVLCESYNLQEEISKYYNDGSIYNYDKVFVTDLFLEEPMLSVIANDEGLKNKFFVFDHHKSSLEENLNKYPFTTIKISDKNGLCSGTSLFYEYLVKNNFIDANKGIIKEFSELTRKYDTWEWKTKYNDEVPHELTLLFDAVGSYGYIDLMYNKLSQKNNKVFEFNNTCKMLINNKKRQIQEKIINYSKNVYYKNILGLKAGIVFIDYEYRNDLAEYFRQNNFDMDFAMLIALDHGNISYRSVRDHVNVRLIALAFGGKGHDKAASSPINKRQKEILINTLTKTKDNNCKIITVCGSLRFKDEIMDITEKMELQGNCMLSCIYSTNPDKDAYTEEEALILDNMHKEKIKLADAILVVNVNNYIGTSTKSEIEFAKSLNKEIIYYTDLINS